MGEKNQMPTEQQRNERKRHWIGQTLHKPQGAAERHALDCNPQGTRKRARQRKPGKKKREWELEKTGES